METSRWKLGSKRVEPAARGWMLKSESRPEKKIRREGLEAWTRVAAFIMFVFQVVQV